MSAESVSTPVPPPLPEAAKPVGGIRWAIHLAIMAAMPLAVAYFGMRRTESQGPALPSNVGGLLVACACNLLVFFLFFIIARAISRASFDALLLRWRPGAWVIPLGLAYSIAVRMLVAVVLIFVAVLLFALHAVTPQDIQHFGQASTPRVDRLIDVEAMSSNSAYFWLNVTVVSFIVAGLREELWRASFLAGLRGLWPSVFEGTKGGIAGAAVAALFFGAGHLPQGVAAAAVITVVGFGLGVIMVVHRSMWPAVVAHGAFDAASFAAIPWMMQHLDQLRHMGTV